MTGLATHVASIPGGLKSSPRSRKPGISETHPVLELPTVPVHLRGQNPPVL